mmetsp:Transcript_2925/g.7456  ORF Transcript_2925/g.7456 Transcript_2925/m.7456 type:complete len:241 (-) Transcript_2925:143-865(-)
MVRCNVLVRRPHSALAEGLHVQGLGEVRVDVEVGGKLALVNVYRHGRRINHPPSCQLPLVVDVLRHAVLLGLPPAALHSGTVKRVHHVLAAVDRRRVVGQVHVVNAVGYGTLEVIALPGPRGPPLRAALLLPRVVRAVGRGYGGELPLAVRTPGARDVAESQQVVGVHPLVAVPVPTPVVQPKPVVPERFHPPHFPVESRPGRADPGQVPAIKRAQAHQGGPPRQDVLLGLLRHIHPPPV